MGQEDAANDHNLKPVQSDDEDSDFPEFEFPVGDCADVDMSSPMASLSVRSEDHSALESNGNSSVRVLLRRSISESPKKMPPAIRNDELELSSLQVRVAARLSEERTQPEISKHVVAEESKTNISLQASLQGAPQRKVLQSNPSFKSLVTTVTDPLKFRSSNLDLKNGEVDDGGESVTDHANAPSTPPSKRLSGILARVGRMPSHDGAKTPDRLRSATSTLSVNALVEKFSTGVRNRVREEAARALSPNPSPRNLTSPRRTMADRSRSPVPRRVQDHPTTPRTLSSPRRSSTAPDRSVSPVPRSWKDSVYGDIPKDRRPNLSRTDPVTPPPRFLTPTRAASLKAVKPPATQSNHSSKSLQFTTAFGITTPVKPQEPARKVPRDAPLKGDHGTRTPNVTEPAGFNFRTDERAERRKDFYSKLEERLKVKEAERKLAEAKAQEEKEFQLRELRKSATYKANPVPRFYQEPAPVPTEIRRTAPTRARSPNFTAPRRRDSCPGSTVSETSSSSRNSPLRSRLLRCASFESNSGHSYKPSCPKPKQPFRPV